MSAGRNYLAAMVLLAGLLGSASAQSAKPTNLADLAKYTGPDRERLL